MLSERHWRSKNKSKNYRQRSNDHFNRNTFYDDQSVLKLMDYALINIIFNKAGYIESVMKNSTISSVTT